MKIQVPISFEELLIPISIGELYDRITILNIKEDHIKDETKLKNIHHEKSLLLKIADKFPLNPNDQNLYLDLYTINKHLWIVEDCLRELEEKKQFDQDFIALARDVYFTNDKRSEVKKQINIKYGSSIIEEKSYKSY